MSQDALHKDTFPEGEAAGRDSEERDAVDAIVEQWRHQRPDLDPSAKHVTGRIVRLAALFQQSYANSFESLGLNEGDYGVLAPLRRSGAPFELTPTELARHRMITSGGMTAAIDRLERKGLVVRVPNPNDRRGSLVRLTASGLDAIDAAMVRHTHTEHELLNGLSNDERSQLERLLRQLLISVDQE